jgi:hypothetical protein
MTATEPAAWLQETRSTAGELSSDEYLKSAWPLEGDLGCEKPQVSEPMSLFDWDGAECP